MGEEAAEAIQPRGKLMRYKFKRAPVTWVRPKNIKQLCKKSLMSRHKNY